jgi:hypothetical protein
VPVREGDGGELVVDAELVPASIPVTAEEAVEAHPARLRGEPQVAASRRIAGASPLPVRPSLMPEETEP